MSKIAIVVDSSFQIKEEQYKDFFVLPLVVTEVINGKTKDYLDMIDIDSEQVSEKLKEGIEIKTSMVPPGRTMALLDRISPLYDQVFMMCIPSKLSSMFNVVSNLAKDYPNVKVFDQSMVATMSTWMVSEIMKARDEGILTEE
jgi:fatty acid-binding protein DegV